MRPLRSSLPAGLYEISTRVTGNHMLARPTEEVNALILGVLGHAQIRHAIKIHAFVFMSNHYHMLVSAPDSQTMSAFMCLLNGNTSRELNIVNDRDGSMWARRFRSIPITPDRASQLWRLRYILAHGVKENLVGKVSEWPGGSSLRWLRHGTAIKGKWIRRTEMFYAKRRKSYVEKPNDFVTVYTIEMTVLPCWRDTPAVIWRREIERMIQEIEAEYAAVRKARGVPPAGVASVLARDPFSRGRRNRSRAPSVLSCQPELGKALRAELHARELMWRRAARAAMDTLAAGSSAAPRALPPMFWGALAP